MLRLLKFVVAVAVLAVGPVASALVAWLAASVLTVMAAIAAFGLGSARADSEVSWAAQGVLLLLGVWAVLARGWLRTTRLPPPLSDEVARGGARPDLVRGVSTGLVVDGLLLAALVARHGLPEAWPSPSPLVWLGVFTMAAAEELLFRGYLLRRIALRAGAGAAAISTSLLFAAVHLPTAVACGFDPPQLALSQAIYVLSALGYALTVLIGGRLWPAVLLHGAWNVLLGLRPGSASGCG